MQPSLKRPTAAVGFANLFAPPQKKCCVKAEITGEVLIEDSDAEAEVAREQTAEEVADQVLGAALAEAVTRHKAKAAAEEAAAASLVAAAFLAQSTGSGSGPWQAQAAASGATSSCASPPPTAATAGEEAQGDEPAAKLEELFDVFKFTGSQSVSGPLTPAAKLRWRRPAAATPPAPARPKARSRSEQDAAEQPAKEPRKCRESRKREAEEEEDFSKMSEESKSQVCEKWRDMAGPAPDKASLRLQLLITALIHPRTNQQIVKDCMAKLLEWAESKKDPSESRILTAKLLAAQEPWTLKLLWEGLHWHKVKAARVVESASTLEKNWGGVVPVEKDQLMKLPGIGPKLGNILSFVIGCLAPADSPAQVPLADDVVKEEVVKEEVVKEEVVKEEVVQPEPEP